MKEILTKTKILAGILTVAWLAFIWGNSMLPGEDSSAVSGWAAEVLSIVFGPRVQEAEFLLRKLAHFSEFALLGVLLTWNRRLWQWPGRFSAPALLGLLAAMTDETIQRFSPGRASMVTDVWIDFAGVCTGILISLLLTHRQNKAKFNA